MGFRGRKLSVTTKIKNLVFGNLDLPIQNTSLLVQPITSKVYKYWELGVLLLGNFIYKKTTYYY